MSAIGQYIRRSIQKLANETREVIYMKGASTPSRRPKSLYTLRSQEDLREFVTGSDRDMGGASSARLELDQDGKGVFKGSLRATVMTSKNVLGGYAAFRSRNRPSLFGPILSDVTFHQFLGMRCRVSGSPQTRNSYFVNLQTDEVAQSTEIWQHRLYFPKGDGSWEDIFIPFDNFICTNAGTIVEPTSSSSAADASVDSNTDTESGSLPPSSPQSAVKMTRDRIKTIGVSLLGSPENDGEFELAIDELWAVNKEDIPERDQEAQVLQENYAARDLRSAEKDAPPDMR